MIAPGTRARVSTPATSANLGPGFDALGLALDIRDDYEVVVADGDDVLVTTIGQSATALPTGPDHLVARSLLIGLERLGGPAQGFSLTCHNRIPQSRGMGSSAAAIVGGVALAGALLGITAADVLIEIATDIEGHPDNVAAAVLGGATISWLTDGRAQAMGLPVLPGITPVLFVPETTSPTAAARAALPDLVPHADAAFNAGRSALLVAALTQDPSLLLAATEDRLHQNQRRAGYAASWDLVAQFRAGGTAAAISGAGPTVLVLTATPEEADEVARQPVTGFTATLTRVGTGVSATLDPPSLS